MWEVIVVMRNMTFPNSSLQHDWYRAKQPIFGLNFDTCKPFQIYADSFTDDVFDQLRVLSFNNIGRFEHRPGLFSGMPRLFRIYFVKTEIYHIQRELFAPIRTYLSEAEFKELPSYLNLDKVFGVTKFLRLKLVKIEDTQYLRTLAPTNFSGLTVVQELIMRNCGIEVILEKTFDYVSVTLTTLSLTHNKLKTLPTTIFNKLLEVNFDTFQYVYLEGNPLICGCDMVELIQLAANYFRNDSFFAPTFNCRYFFNRRKPVYIAIVEKCINLQVIHHKNVCLKPFGKRYFSHPKFALKVDELTGNISIQTVYPWKFRVLISNHGAQMQTNLRRPNCPKYDWLISSSKCLKLKFNGTVQIRIPLFKRKSPYTTICVNYIATRGMFEFWPLNCITIHEPEIVPITDEFWCRRDVLIALLSLCAVIGALVGIVLPILSSRLIEWRRLQSVDGEKIPFGSNDSRKCVPPPFTYSDDISYSCGYEYACVDIGCSSKETIDIDQNSTLEQSEYAAVDVHGYIIFESNMHV